MFLNYYNSIITPNYSLKNQVNVYSAKKPQNCSQGYKR